MPDISSYVANIELALVSSAIIAEYHIVRSWANTDDGYIRLRATLTNQDFLEAAEYFTLQEDRIVTVDYHFQWMDGERKTLRRRWDSTPHFPKLENFPHHIHTGAHETVIPGSSISLIDLLQILEDKIAQL